MRKFILSLILLLNSLNFFAQTEETKPKNWIVKWNATAAIDAITFPTIQFAIERKLGSYFSVQTEAGIQAYSFKNNVDTLSVNDSGFRLMAEGRFYLFNYLKKDKTKKRNSDGLYTGIQGFYRENKYNETTTYYKSEYDFENPETATAFEDNFGVIKKAYGINLALGFQKQFNKFVIEPHMYLGFMNKKVKNKDREFDENLGHVEDNGNHDFFNHTDKEESSGNYFNFALGFRIGYKF